MYARLVKLVNTSDLKSDPVKGYRFKSDSEYHFLKLYFYINKNILKIIFQLKVNL